MNYKGFFVWQDPQDGMFVIEENGDVIDALPSMEGAFEAIDGFDRIGCHEA